MVDFYKDALTDSNGDGNSASSQIVVMSFGFKQGDPPCANLLLDVRFLKNPYWVPELRPLTGLDMAVRDYVIGQESAQACLQTLLALLQQIVPASFSTGKSESFVVALGCTGGQHRSVAMAEELSRFLQEEAFAGHLRVVRYHRELATANEIADEKMDHKATVSGDRI
jgi:UPF0042 nucleotide-binding protein